MEVNFSAVRSCSICWLERVSIKNSPATRGAEAARTVTPLRLSAGITVGRLLGDVHVDSGFDLRAIGAESCRLELGHLVADPTDLLRRRCFVEETQPCTEHHGSSSGRRFEIGGEPQAFLRWKDCNADTTLND